MSLVFAAVLLAAVHPTIERASQYVQSLWDQLPALQCTERISQKRIDVSGKAIETQAADYDYVVFLKSRGLNLLVEESRVAQSKATPSADTLLATSGFSSLPFVFHPAFSDGFEFEEPLTGGTAEPGVVRVVFRARLQSRPMAALKVRGRTYPIHWRGTAWIEESTGVIVRIRAQLADIGEVEGLGIRELNADVQYSRATLSNPPRSVVLPARTVIRLATARQQWETIHEFSRYRSFSVTTSTKTPGSR